MPRSFDDLYILNTDISSLYRPHSPSLPQRRAVYKPNNKIKGNRPVEVGYELSVVGLSVRRPLYGISEPCWNLPLSMRLVPYELNKNSFTATQVNDLLDNKELPFHKTLTVNALDSSYCSPEYIAATHKQEHLVNIIRMPSNRKVWKQASIAQKLARRLANKKGNGAPLIYGEQYKLNEYKDWDLPADQSFFFGIKSAKGKSYVVQLEIWEDMMIRTKRGQNMKDKSFRLVRIQLLDAQSGQAIYKRPMWLSVWGQKATQLSPEQIYWAYRNRYDIEHFFRFGKQKLLLDKYQTPEEQHLDNWMEVVSMAYWLLFVAKEEVNQKVYKWQQYDSNLKNRKRFGLCPTPSQVQLQLEALILSFEQSPFLPQSRKKGKGRAKGMTFKRRKRYKVVKKNKKRRKAS